MRLAGVTVALVGLALGACSAGSPAPDTEIAAQAGLAQAASVGEGGSVAAGLTVAGAGEATGIPDVVRVTVGVEVERGSVQEALDAANAATEQVLGALDAAGIAAEDRQTREFSINPVYGGTRDAGEPEIRGYMVVNLVEASVRDIDRVGEVLDAVADAGGDNTRIQGISFDLEDDGEQLTAARQRAFEDARATAEQYAEITRRSLGALIGIEDVTVGSPRSAARVALESAADAAVPIEPGEQHVVVRVLARWALD